MPKLSRRNVLIGSAVLIGGVTILNKPSDQSGPRDPYFVAMQQALVAAGIATPTLVIDRARLNANIDTLVADLPDGMGYRIVAKSLPSEDLLAHIRQRSGSDRLMTFNLPMLQQLAVSMPDADQLLGKPLPAAAARTFFEELPEENAAAADNIQWLVDTPERLAQYAQIAEDHNVNLRINLELDVGLHRGGFVADEALRDALQSIRRSNRLSLSGVMGYEPHLASIPTALGWQDRAINGSWEVYQAVLTMARDEFGDAEVAGFTRNVAGSPTYRLYENTELGNEISAGSTLVKPSHFDTDLLEAHQPAAFIATPVIKAIDQTQLPGTEFADGARQAWDPNLEKSLFIYGGHWLADPVDPPGLTYNSQFGRSSNQEMLNGGSALDIAADDFVFMRPHQSEAVFLQFGDIVVYDAGEIVDYWPVFPASA